VIFVTVELINIELYSHLQMAGSSHASLERRLAGGLLLTKLEEVNKSVKVCVFF